MVKVTHDDACDYNFGHDCSCGLANRAVGGPVARWAGTLSGDDEFDRLTVTFDEGTMEISRRQSTGEVTMQFRDGKGMSLNMPSLTKEQATELGTWLAEKPKMMAPIDTPAETLNYFIRQGYEIVFTGPGMKAPA